MNTEIEKEIYEIESSRVGFNVTDKVINEFRINLIKGKWNAQELLTDNFMENDPGQYQNLTPAEQKYIVNILIFFASGDDEIFDFIMKFVLSRIKSREWIGYEIQKLSNEEIHSETYALLIMRVVPDISDMILSVDTFRNSIAEKKLKWCRDSIGTDKPLANVVFSLLILEALFFSSSFAAIFWFRSRNLLLGIANSNTMIANDEGEHNRCYFYIYSTLKYKLSQKEAEQILKSATEIELEFVNAITPDSVGMNPTLMSTYVKFVADDIITKCGYNPIYNVKNPFSFMNEFGLTRKVDNFRFKNTEYQKYVEETFTPGQLTKFWN